MTSLGVVPALDPFKDPPLGVFSGFKVGSVDLFCFQAVDEALAMSVVPAASFSGYAGNIAN